MPLLQYFSFVGTALLLLLLGLNWLLPESKADTVRADIERPVIRISSIEKLPEKTIYDMSLPTIVPPPTIIANIVPIPQSAFAFVQITPGPLPVFSPVSNVTRTARVTVEPVTAKKHGRRVARHNAVAATERTVPVTQPVVRLSEAITNRIRHGFF